MFCPYHWCKYVFINFRRFFKYSFITVDMVSVCLCSILQKEGMVIANFETLRYRGLISGKRQAPRINFSVFLEGTDFCCDTSKSCFQLCLGSLDYDCWKWHRPITVQHQCGINWNRCQNSMKSFFTKMEKSHRVRQQRIHFLYSTH